MQITNLGLLVHRTGQKDDMNYGQGMVITLFVTTLLEIAHYTDLKAKAQLYIKIKQ